MVCQGTLEKFTTDNPPISYFNMDINELMTNNVCGEHV